MSRPLLEFRSVSMSYAGRPALAEVSFTIQSGDHTALLGPSGCGKTTVLRLLAGLETPNAGDVLLGGQVASRAGQVMVPPHRRGVAMVFQDLALWPNLSVLGNVLLGLSAAALSRREARARAREALVLCGIEALAERPPATLSGGQQQRVALARALAVRPTFLLLDEPFSGLDLVTKTRLLEEIPALATARHLTVLLVAHDPLEATTLCRMVLVLDQGRLAECGAFTDLLPAPRSELLKVFRDRLGAGQPGDPGRLSKPLH